jgi:hypothetical protein
VISFISPSAAENNPAIDWAGTAAEQINRQCPECLDDSVIGHGWRRKQAHDEQHDWIAIHRGYCGRCLKTITFLPEFSLPYTHYSLITRSQALELYFIGGRSLDLATPLVRDPNRVPAASTLRRWFRSLDSAARWDRLRQLQPEAPEASPTLPPSSDSKISIRPTTSFPFLQQMVRAVNDRLTRGENYCYDQLVLSRRTLAHFLQLLLPLRC